MSNGDLHVVDIPLDQIEFSKVKMRAAQTKRKEFHELMDRIRLRGFDRTRPILLRPMRDEQGNVIPNKYEGVDGCQRTTIMGMLAEQGMDITSIPAIVEDMSDDDARIRQMMLNENVPTTKAEKLNQVKAFMASNPHMKQAEVAQLFGMSQPSLSQLLNLDRLIPRALTLAEQGEITAANAVSLSRVPEEYQDKYVEAAVNKKSTEFYEFITREIRSIRAEKRGEKADSAGPIPVLRKKIECVEKLNDLQYDLNEMDLSDPDYEKQTALVLLAKWFLKVDPETLAQIKAEREANKKEKTLEAQEKELADLRKKQEELEARIKERQSKSELVDSLN